MGKTVEYADAEPVKMKKESKKNKNMTDDDTLISGDDNNHVETDGDHLKKKKKDKHMEKKRKSETKEDGETDGDTLKKKKDKHKEKKSKSESKEDGETDGGSLKKKKDKHKEKKSKSESKDNETDDDSLKQKESDKHKEKKSNSESKKDETDGDGLKKKKDKHKEKKSESESKEDGETAGEGLKKKDKHKKKTESESKEDGETDGDILKKKKDKHKEKKSKSESKEDGDEDQRDKGNLVNDDSQKKDKKRKRKHSSEEVQVEENELDPKPEKKKKKTKKIDCQNLDIEMNIDKEDKSMKKQKVKGSKAKSKAIESGENNTEKPKKKSKSKKVSFSGYVEVFPPSDSEPDKQTTNGDGLLRGKRFTPEEDEIVKKAVLDYVVEKGLGDDGLKMVLNCRSHKGMKKCWQEIGLCIPYRPYTAVYYRAHNLFERAESRTWTPEEFQLLREYHKKYGNDWKKLAAELGKHRFHVKDAWRRIKFENLKSGRWTQEEYQQLYDLVNLDLQMKINGEEKKKSKHGMLRDNIPWTAISEKLSTRTDATCCEKWYNQLTSSLVVEKKWADADDYRMIGVLYELDAACIEDVEWDDILEHRPGEICLKRWHQMVKYIGDYRSKSFNEQVDILAQRYCPDLAETRETWDNKPLVD
ncbi:uncharacterized protein LOC143594180 isoform X1 [Bidens hawaiensis]|uniref:uncharacterized protein LOC143594180 isoform X1 n=1 Tax=Bidens hawaiensis TaxID=980011 RepID=UPI00404979C6